MIIKDKILDLLAVDLFSYFLLHYIRDQAMELGPSSSALHGGARHFSRWMEGGALHFSALTDLLYIL